MTQFNITLNGEDIKGLFTEESKDRAFADLVQKILNQVLQAQATEQIGAKKYERNDNRTAYRNGTRERGMNVRVGQLILDVPRLRNGNFSTTLFHEYQRSEQVLVLSMMEMVINGVSTRKVKEITRQLCGTEFSKSTVSALCAGLDPVVAEFRNRPLDKSYPFVIVDALYTRVRENHRVRNKGLMIAIGINNEGYREIIGFAVDDTESEESWNNFFKSLKERGLSNIDTITSDSHMGLANAIKKQFHNASWQRCQTHFSKNLLDKIPNTRKAEVKAHLTDIYNAPDKEAAIARKDDMVGKYKKEFPKAMNLLDDSFEDITAVFSLPEHYRRRLRTSNCIERLNEEIRRRERVIRVFPNEESLIRLLGALLMEQHEKWISGRKYFDMDEYHEHIKGRPLVLNPKEGIAT
jgi:transposase-like protein